MSLNAAMNAVDTQDIVNARTARRRSVAANAVLEIMSTFQRTIVSDNDAMVQEALYQLLGKITSDAKVPTMTAPSPVNVDIQRIADDLAV